MPQKFFISSLHNHHVESRIKVLPPALVEKIAAGEVVERPASVVKELVENSIDAGATRIEIFIRDGGIKEIRVVDDGCGMSREDAVLAFKRYATSKIRGEADLFRISSLGFRGEALPSIAAVSRVTLITRRKEEIAGTRLIIEGGKVKDIQDTGAPPGTSILVRDLFYNVPARKKFLKSVRAEYHAIAQTVEKYALMYENIHFKLVNNGRQILQIPPSDLISRISKIWGREIARDLISVKLEKIGIRVEGAISKPHLTRKDRSKILIFVNGRPVKSKLVEDAIIRGYGTLLFRDSYPYAVIKLWVPPDSVDVNVHPAKLLVKFRDEEKITRLVATGIWESLVSKDNIPSVKKMNKTVHPEPVAVPRVSHVDETHFEVDEAKIGKKIEDFIPLMRTSRMVVLGQIGDTYIVLRSPEGLVIVDQHAAHERIRYERFLREMREKKIQKLLEPIILHLDFVEYTKLLQMRDALKDFGFIIDDFGSESMIIRGIPPLLTKGDAEEAIKDIVSLGPRELETRRDDIVKLISCKGAIKANQKLSVFEMEKLVEQLLRCENPYTCPHGRPTMIKLKLEDLERLFKRKE